MSIQKNTSRIPVPPKIGTLASIASIIGGTNLLRQSGLCCSKAHSPQAQNKENFITGHSKHLTMYLKRLQVKVLQIITEVFIYKLEILQFIFIKVSTSSLSIFIKCSFYIMLLRQALLSN